MRGVTRRELRAMLRAAGRRAVPESERLGVPATSPLQMFVGAPASRHEVRSMLGAAGTRPVPPLSPAFVALADPVGQSLPPALTVDPRPGAERRSRRPALLIGAAAAVLTVMLVAALTGVVGGPEAEAELALGAAVDTVVVLPDGSTV
ncbi:MAG TPA: hypothetical protein VIH82_07575, partial [Acidimicrobiia bacterium]